MAGVIGGAIATVGAGVLTNELTKGGGEKSVTSSAGSRFFNPEDDRRVNQGLDQLGADTQRFKGTARAASNRIDQSLQDFEGGRLGARGRGLLSQAAQTQRQLQGARQTALASQGFKGQQAKILGAQGALQSDLGLNQARFAAAQQQRGDLATQQAGLQSLVGLRGKALDAQQGLQTQGLNTAIARGGQTGGSSTGLVGGPSPVGQIVGTGIMSVANQIGRPSPSTGAADTPVTRFQNGRNRGGLA